MVDRLTRRLDAHWHRSTPNLDVVIGMVHITLTEDEATRLRNKIDRALTVPQDERKRSRLQEASQ